MDLGPSFIDTVAELTQDEKNTQLANATVADDAGADIDAADLGGYTALIRAALWGQTDLVAKLITAGAKIEAINHDGDTALILAAAHGHAAVVTQLIAAGANIEATNEYGYTALMSAACLDNPDLVAQLITAGANKEAANQLDETALILAERNNHENAAAEEPLAPAPAPVTFRYSASTEQRKEEELSTKQHKPKGNR